MNSQFEKHIFIRKVDYLRLLVAWLIFKKTSLRPNTKASLDSSFTSIKSLQLQTQVAVETESRKDLLMAVSELSYKCLKGTSAHIYYLGLSVPIWLLLLLKFCTKGNLKSLWRKNKFWQQKIRQRSTYKNVGSDQQWLHLVHLPTAASQIFLTCSLLTSKAWRAWRDAPQQLQLKGILLLNLEAPFSHHNLFSIHLSNLLFLIGSIASLLFFPI